MIEIKPINVGIGGPLSALITGFTGVSKNLPWWTLCPLYCVIGAPLVLLCPVLMPLWLLKVMVSRKAQEQIYHEQAISEEFENLQASKEKRLKLQQDKDFTIKSQLDKLNSQESVKEPSAAKAQEIESSNEQDKVASDKELDKADTKDSSKEQAKGTNQDDAIEGIGTSDVNLAKARKALIEEEMYQERTSSKLKYHLISVALAKVHLASFIQANFITLLVSTIAYYLGLVLSFVVSSSMINEAMERYMSIASNRKVLQIATQEQLDYANSVVNIITGAGALMLIMMLITFALVTLKAIKYALNQSNFNQELGSELQASLSSSLGSMVFKVLLVNLPGMGVLAAMMYACFINLERYYSHLRMIAMEDMVLGQEYFDPSWLFLGIRAYLIYAFVLAFALVIFMSLHILPLNHQKHKQLIG